MKTDGKIKKFKRTEEVKGPGGKPGEKHEIKLTVPIFCRRFHLFPACFYPDGI